MKENLIKSLIDLRIIEATKKKISHKLATIAEHLGCQIVGEYNYGSILPDFWEYEMEDPYNAERVVEASENSSESVLGYSYDSLKYGVNFEIVVRTYGDKTNLIRANFNGNTVYVEEEGVITGYSPKPEWEIHMESLYEHAVKIEKNKNEEQNKIDKEEFKVAKKTFFQKLKLIWGYE